MSNKVVSNYSVEIRFRPDAGFLDKRGAVAQSLTSSGAPFKRWNVSANAIDFTRDDNQHIRAFFSYRNLGVLSTPPNASEYFVATAEKFLAAAWEHLPNREFSRAGVRSVLLIETEDFAEAVAAYRRRFLGLTDKEVQAFGGDLIDVGFPMNFVKGKDHFNVITGPMERGQSLQFFRDTHPSLGAILQRVGRLPGGDSDATDLPAVGLFVDVDFFRENLSQHTTVTTMLGLLRRGVKKAQGIADLIEKLITEED
ncbi:hypothetical protein LCGC14_0565550 [marine sediment metagenome]|uniref:Uncharacterized protein n=1 Tax=marine sediment metagenome TaxID=412755 RepID=A0A0F9UTX0_9ZZZZ